MYHDDHEPPHFHIWFSGKRAVMEIGRSRTMRGRLPPRVYRMVSEWAALHERELVENWERAKSKRELKRIAPLE